MTLAASRSLKSPCLWVTATECVSKPSLLSKIDSKIKASVKNEFWGWLKLELDETSYGFGICYGIECESSEPERVKKLIERFLEENGIEYEILDRSQKGPGKICCSSQRPDARGLSCRADLSNREALTAALMAGD
ncbi:hypothetical protein Patl1_34549 [Pistacia atlantica]|uniref:Uncharacterized protein n=1 Tax=Pistacia atlantica TaxID=434234 RepID=A0ACC0ZNR7_9ROSI|nr:hypothetical protein Patl1_34549 [Pistacia atlantica]